MIASAQALSHWPSALRATADARPMHWLVRARQWATLLDAAWGVPGTKIRFGVDTLLGLIPGAGDVASTALGLVLVYEARRHGASRGLLLRMCVNLLLDLLVGVVPLVGDLSDLMVKANLRNLRLMEAEFGRAVT